MTTNNPSSEPNLNNSMPGLVLVLDTTGSASQVGVVRDGKWLIQDSREMTYGQAEHLIPMVKEAMTSVGEQFADLSAVVVTVGPGSFTGLRVGLAAAQGISVVAKCPVIGVSSLAAWATSSAHVGSVRVCLDSRRGDAFVQDFDADRQPLSDGMILAMEIAERHPADMICIGDLISGQAAPPLAAIYVAACHPSHQLPAEPLYLRAPDAVPSCK
jgi:tRNA threonylcarbamoyladenosine biosynthesis protein TsaB